jgi:hypothetical protein
VSVIVALAAAGSASAAFQPLPPGQQVNNDPAAGIDPAKPVDIGDPTNSDVVGGSLTGGVQVPWSIFRQQTTGADQIFSRSFAGGKWTTRGHGTVGGLNNGPFSGSLNFDQSQDGEAPSIDFAGTGRTVPWATWYEHNTTFGGKEQIFASRFDNTGDANQGKWIFSGQDRGSGVPSLNINTNQDAENPVVAGGSTNPAKAPGPWITWQETDANASGTTNQIFVSRPVGPGTTTCPAGTKPSGGTPIGGFCFQQVGIARVNANADPSLNIDPKRDGIEPDIAFTGPNDTVPWVVWYEINNGSLGNNNDQVFAAKAVAPDGTQTGTVDGGFNWIAVGGNGGSGRLDVAGHNPCLASLGAEQSCTLNANPAAGAVDPTIAAGTMTPGNATVPWVAWEEASGGHERIFVSRLVNGFFKLANSGRPLPTLVPGIDAQRPDITFSGNTPYVTWHEGSSIVTGHFTTPDSFVIDSNHPVGSNVPDSVRAPISSGCTATPFNRDGSSCQAGATGTPFFLFTDTGQSEASLFADAYQPGSPATGQATGVTTSAATLNGAVNPEGAAVKVSFDYGATTAYGQNISAGKTAVSNASTPFSAVLTGLKSKTTIHYRAVATSDLGRFVGPDQTLTTASSDAAGGNGSAGAASVGHARLKHTAARVRITCNGSAGQTCRLSLTMTVTEKRHGRRLIAITARKRTRKTIVTVGTTSVRLSAGRTKVATVSLNRIGKRLLAKRHHLSATLTVKQSLGANHTTTVSRQTVRFKASTKGHGRR